MSVSRLFGEKGPKKPHLSQVSGGVAAEVTDLRSDIEETFVQMEVDASGTTAARNVAAFKASLYDGFVFFDTTLKQLFVWDKVGAAWISAGKGGTVSNTTATTNSGTASIQSTRRWHAEELVPAAGGTLDYHAAYVAGAPIDDAGPFTQLLPARTAAISAGMGSAAMAVTITGTTPQGDAQTETINTPGGMAVTQGVKVWGTITHVLTDVDPGAAFTVKAGAGFALSKPFDGNAGSLLVGVDGVLEVPTSSDPTTGMVIPATAPEGTHRYHVKYLDTGHVHGDAGHTHTQAAHTHTIT